jgi:hypothetical protein
MKPINNSNLLLDNWIAFDLEWISTRQDEKRSSHSDPEANVTKQKRYEYTNWCHMINRKTTSGTSGPSVNTAEKIVTFGYEDSYGNKGVFDMVDFQNSADPSRAFLSTIKERLLKYGCCFGWGSKSIKRKNELTSNWDGINGDLVVLDHNFHRHNVQSIVRYDKFTGIPYIRQVKTFDIDLLKVFVKPLVKSVIFRNKYKGLGLDEVATALLGYGKLDNISGANIEKMSIEERKKYCQHDAHLVAELVGVENGNILKIMQITADHTGLSLEEVCHKGMTGIWTKIMNDAITKKAVLVGFTNMPNTLRKMHFKNYSQFIQADNDDDDPDNLESDSEEDDDEGDEFEDRPEFDHTDSHNYSYNQNLLQRITIKNNSASKYKGGVVLQPKRGLHQGVHVFDVTSLYPTMIIQYNLSPETVNCRCCTNNSKARELFKSEITQDLVYISKEGNYWICQRRQGLFPRLLQQLTQQRIKYKNSGLKIESLVIKAIINSGYGVFGHPYFKYYDPRVAELVTAFGRHTLNRMQKIAGDLGFEVLYGDTDSLFVNNLARTKDVVRFIQECKNQLDTDVTHEKTFSKLILAGKKHYVGIPLESTKEPVIKGMEGIKSDRPKFIHKTFMQLVDDIKNGTNPIPNLKLVVDDLNQRSVPVEMLAISLVLRKDPDKYTNDCKQRRLGIKRGLRKGDILIYYKSHVEESIPETGSELPRITKVVSESDNPGDISYARYKEMLLSSVRDILEILGYDVERELLNTQKIKLKDSLYFRRGITA